MYLERGVLIRSRTLNMKYGKETSAQISNLSYRHVFFFNEPRRPSSVMSETILIKPRT